MICHHVHHIPIRVFKHNVVLKEITMCSCMGNNRKIVHQRIVSLQVHISWVSINYHFVNLTEPMMILMVELFKLLAEGEVWVSDGKSSVCSDFHYFIGIILLNAQWIWV